METPKVLSESKSYLIVYKPAGWIVNSAITTKGQPVLQEWLEKNLDYEIARNKELRSGIIHRIDKETSGVLIVAKNEKAMKHIQGQFKKRTVKKEYIALLHGKLEPKEGEVKVPVGRLPWNRERFGVLPGGRPSETRFSVNAYFKKGKEHFTLATFFPRTGRTHQIRIHSKYLGHPIVSDEFYAGRKTSRKDRTWCPRLFLHAHGIQFDDPESEKKVKFKSDLPDDLKACLESLEVLE